MGKYEKKRPARSSRMMNRVFFWCFVVVIAVIVFLAVLILGKGAGDSETTSQTEPEQTLQLQTTGEKEIMEGTQSQPSNEGALLEDQTAPPLLELSLESIEQDAQTMAVKTSYCVLRYPFAFSDIIRVEVAEQMGRGALVFYANLNNTDWPMFSLSFDDAGGLPVGTLPLSDGTTVSVKAQIFETDEAMDPDMRQTFYAAQECINDVISSLTDTEGFVPVQ